MASQSILIAGAGIGGLTLATALAKAGRNVVVLEQASTLDDVGAGIQIGPNAMHVLGQLGVTSALLTHAFKPAFATLRDYQDGRILIRTPLNPTYEGRFGAPYVHCHRADLMRDLYTRACAQGVDVHFDTGVSRVLVEADGVQVETNGRSFNGDLLVGADGIHSIVRRQMITTRPARFTGQTAWRGLVDANRFPAGLIEPDATVWLGPQRHVVAYYVRGGTWINFVAVTEQATWLDEDWQRQGEAAALLDYFEDWHPAVSTLLTHCEAVYQWGLFEHALPDRWSADRVVLLGDACHAMLPFMAQGAAMAIEDAWVLASLLTNRSTSRTAFELYERHRRPRLRYVMQQSRQNARRFHLGHPLAVGARNAAFALASRVPALAAMTLDRLYGVNVTMDHPLGS
ncbi:MAG: FAD-dependent monooxygenase [Pseudomonadota bacterium]